MPDSKTTSTISPALEKAIKKVIRDNIDLHELHLADEQSIINMQKTIEALEKKLELIKHDLPPRLKMPTALPFGQYVQVERTCFNCGIQFSKLPEGAAHLPESKCDYLCLDCHRQTEGV